MALTEPITARALRCGAAALLVVGLSGCIWPGGQPDRTDVRASAAPAAAIADEVGPEARCAEEVFWGGAPDGPMPDAAGYAPGFALPGPLEGFDVLCAASWTFMQNECQMRFSRAYIDGGQDGARLDEIDEALKTWAVDHGMQQTEIGKSDNTNSYGFDVQAEDAALMTMLQWDAVSRYEGADEVQRQADMAGIPLDGGDVWVSWQVCPAQQGWETPP